MGSPSFSMSIGYLQQTISDGKVGEFHLRNKKPKRKLATLLLKKANHRKITKEKYLRFSSVTLR
jgi:hypothetical protein